MPWSATISSAKRPCTLARICTRPPSSVYFTAFSTRLPSAETSWRRSPQTRPSLRPSSTAISMPRAAASWRTRSTASATMSPIGTASVSGDSPSSMRDSSIRSSIVPVTRSASATIRSATRCTTSGSLSPDSASASTARAPTGVFSSWLMLATKSVRTASTRRRSLTSSIVATADAVGKRLGGDDDGELAAARTARASGAIPARRAPGAARASTASSSEQPHVGARPLGRLLVAVAHGAVSRHHDHAERQLVDDRRPRRARRRRRPLRCGIGGDGLVAGHGHRSWIVGGPATHEVRRGRTDGETDDRHRWSYRALHPPSPAPRRSCHSRSLAAWRSA